MAQKRAHVFLPEGLLADIGGLLGKGQRVQAVTQFFPWCETHRLQLRTIRPPRVSGYIKSNPLTTPSIRQHLAALQMRTLLESIPRPAR